MPAKKIIINVVIVIVLVALGAFIGMSIPSKNNNSYQAGWDAAKKRLQDTGYYSVPPISDAKTVSGIVEKLSDNSVSIKIRPFDPFDSADLDTRAIEIDGNTKIYEMVQKDPAQLQKEFQEYNQKAPKAGVPAVTSGPMVTPPQPFDKKEIKLSDIKVGQQIMVTSNDNVRNLKNIKAIEIDVQSMAAAMPVPATGAAPIAK